MNQVRTRSLAVAVVLVSVILLSGCNRGGGGGGGGGGGDGELLLITADGAAQPLWELVAGVPTVPSVCPEGVFNNARIVFTFNGAVDPASLPTSGYAFGSFIITSNISGLAATGSFSVEDDPSVPAGNHRRVVFRPTLPTGPGAQCTAGIMPGDSYQITVPAADSWPLVVVVSGDRIQQGATTCFGTCGCPDPGACGTSFIDPVAGNPYVVSTLPATNDPAPAAVDPCAIGNTIEILVNEPLDPNGIDLQNVRVINAATAAQVPGSLIFHQAGNTGPSDLMSRIDYVASIPLLANVTYQIVFGPAVVDLGGNPIQTSQSNPAMLLFFQTIAAPTLPQPPLVENFDTPSPGGTTGAASWSGDGFLRSVFPTELIGNGSDGAFNPPVSGTPLILDTNELVNGVSRQGIWNFTSVNIPNGATVRIIGPYLAHIRCMGTFTLDGILRAIPGQTAPPLASTPPYDGGAQNGQQNNGLGIDCEANGGAGNAGGGAGGAGSGITPPPGSPSNFQCFIRALIGENGYGPSLDGQPNGSPGNILYAGGQGGISGCFPSLAPCTPSLTQLGGLGGAGGTAARVGEAGIPRLGTCLPNLNVTQPVAQPSPISVAMIPPIAQQSAGSGGGGGGDHLEAAGTPPNNDDQGGGGGGGGGGIRISCGEAYAQGPTGQINVSGTTGGNASNFSGAGGSGSGGEVWIQAFTSVTFSPTSLISVIGPARLFPSAGLIGCSAQASGAGGPGLVQVEAGTGPAVLPNFVIQPTPTPTSGAVFSNPPFIYAGGVTGQGRSGLRFVGVPGPDYTGTAEVFTLGNAAGATVMITYRGAQEAVNSTPQNPIFDPATIKSTASGGGPITAANLDELDGYAFIEFIVDFSYPAPPMTPQSAILPSVDSITINFSASSCP